MSRWLIPLVFVVLAGCSSNDDDDALVTCNASALPKTGQRCDPSTVPSAAYCRLSSCSSQCRDECACRADGRWWCTNSCRDSYGCGTPPLCGVGCTDPPIDSGVGVDSGDSGAAGSSDAGGDG